MALCLEMLKKYWSFITFTFNTFLITRNKNNYSYLLYMDPNFLNIYKRFMFKIFLYVLSAALELMDYPSQKEETVDLSFPVFK